MDASIGRTFGINPDLEQSAQELFSYLGLDLATAVNVFLRRSIDVGGFPFDVRVEEPNAVTLAALEEGDRMINDPNAKRFSSVDELFAELIAE